MNQYQWISADSPERPKSGETVFIAIRENGKVCVRIGFWAARHSLTRIGKFEPITDMEWDHNNVWYMREGWYEWIYDEYGEDSVRINSCTITHWTRPDPPEETR